MFALPIFPGRQSIVFGGRKCPVGSEPSAACGRESEVSEWQRSIKSSILRDAMILSGTASGLIQKYTPPFRRGYFFLYSSLFLFYRKIYGY